MTDTLEDTIAEAKDKRRKADAFQAAQDLDAEGLLPGSKQTDKPSAFAASAVDIAKAQHSAKEQNVQQTHSNVEKLIISPIIELAVISEAAHMENDIFKKYDSVDELTKLENQIIVEEIDEIHNDILQLLVSVDARGRDDANHNLQSLVAGEQSRIMAESGMLPMQTGGIFGRIKRALGGK
jgi:hypothetical protein